MAPICSGAGVAPLLSIGGPSVTFDEMKLAYLERLYDHASEGWDGPHRSGEYLWSEFRLEQQAALRFVSSLADQGLVRDTSGLAGPEAVITAAGRSIVERARAERPDPRVQEEAARSAFLRYAGSYETVWHLGFSRTPFAQWNGIVLTDREALAAADYLTEKGLIKAHDRHSRTGAPRFAIAALGRDCLAETDGNVAAFLKSLRNSGPTVSIGTYNQHGGNNAVGSQHFTQTATSGTDMAQMATFVEQLLAGLAQFGLGEDEADARAALEAVRAEATAANPEPGKMQSAISKFMGFVAGAGKPVLTAFFLFAAQKFGIPPTSTP